MPTRLILIRHGATEWNLKKRYCGFMDIGLSNKGKKQAKKLRHRLKKEEIFRVYSSDRKRAIETAKIVFKRIKIERIPALREIHFGIFEGLTHKEILKRYPGIYKKWLKDPFSIDIPGGEKINNFRKRIVKAFRRIIKVNKNKTIAVVCHAGVISIFINNILKSKGFWSRIPSSASLSVIEYRNVQPKIHLFNCTKHLNG